MHKVAVSIVNYNSGQYLTKCLLSLHNLRDEIDFEIFVIDNNSSDNSVDLARQKFANLHYILNKENLGFAKANNIVLREINTKYILILNPDVEVGKGVIPKLIKYLEENVKVGAITSKIILSNGKIDLTAHRGFPTPWASFFYAFFKSDRYYHLTFKDLTKIHEVDALSGAFILTTKEALESVDYFDEDYFMYGEDIDLCYKVKQKGYKIIYDPEVEVIHHKGVSTGLKKHSQKISTANLDTKVRSLNAFYSSMKIFYKKHYAKTHPFFINWLVYLGINIKWLQAKRKLLV